MKEKLIIIPAYNERENIEAIIRYVFNLSEQFDILIVEDNSPDETAEIVRSLQKEYPDSLYMLNRPEKLGLGTAYIAGFRWAIERDYEYIFEMDADFSHNPDDLLKLYTKCLNGADLAIGSRYITGVNVVNWPMSRVLMSYCASKYVRMITGMPIRDTTAGFVCYRKKTLEAIDLNHIKFKGYAFQIEMKFMTWIMGFSIQEVSIIFTDRSKGVSKMTGGIFNEAFWGVIGMKIKSLLKLYPNQKRR